MKPNLHYDETLLDNRDKFEDPFFKRFQLRPAPQPLRLDDKTVKTYSFPTFYADVTCAIGIFLCDYERARAHMMHPRIKPLRMTRGRSLVLLSCYEYKNVMNVPPYNEIAMTIPVQVDPAVDVPVLPMVMGGFPSFGFYVFGMPVTSKENQIRGNRIWGLPKVTEEIDVVEDGGECVTTARDASGATYFELRVPTTGKMTHFDERANLYSNLDGTLLQSRTCFKGTFAVNKYMKLLVQKGVKPARPSLTVGSGSFGAILKDLLIEEHPFQFRYARGLNSAFSLPNPDYKIPAGLQPLL